MNYLAFHKKWHRYGCFNVVQIRCWDPGFNRHNLRYWIDKGLIVSLRRGWYAFADLLSAPDFAEFIANQIYAPSYISLQYAMAHYGMIPEAVLFPTSITARKTASFSNPFGTFSYRSVKPSMIFGYDLKLMTDGRAIRFANPEKALIDFLYLNPFYQSPDDMLNLRLDEDFMASDLDLVKFMGYVDYIGSEALASRVATLLDAYGITTPTLPPDAPTGDGWIDLIRSKQGLDLC